MVKLMKKYHYVVLSKDLEKRLSIVLKTETLQSTPIFSSVAYTNQWDSQAFHLSLKLIV